MEIADDLFIGVKDRWLPRGQQPQQERLRTSNPIESIFSGVRLRTDAAPRPRCRNNAPYLILKMVERLGSSSSQYASLEVNMVWNFSQ